MIGGWYNGKADINIEYDCSNSNQVIQVGACNTNEPKAMVHDNIDIIIAIIIIREHA